MQLQTGCDGNHVALKCVKLRELSLSERRRALEKSGLCMSKACRRAGVLQPKRPDEAQVPAARVRGKAYHWGT